MASEYSEVSLAAYELKKGTYDHIREILLYMVSHLPLIY